MRLIDADALSKAMYDEAFENDESYNETNPMARWDSGLWIRYKMFENILKNAPTIEPCEDAISRESVITAIGERVKKLQADRDRGATSRAIDLCGIIPLINDIPPEAVVSRTDFEDVIKKLGERNCFTCGVYHDGQWIYMARDPEAVTPEELDANDRVVSLAEVCKILQEEYEVCPRTWGRLRNLPSVAPSRPKEESIIEACLLESSTREAYEEGYAKGKEESRPSGMDELVEGFAKALTCEDVVTAEAEAKGYAQGFKDGMKSRPSGEWIPVKERKPSTSWDRNLVSLVRKDGQDVEEKIRISYYFKATDFLEEVWSDIPMGYEVVAWMPLPEPYKESE